MSASKLVNSDIFHSLTVQSPKTVLTLSSNSFRIRKNGIEFKTTTAISPWTEMTVELQLPTDSKKLHCTGVVVACHGNRHSGYTISMLFTNLTKQSQARLTTMAFSAVP